MMTQTGAQHQRFIVLSLCSLIGPEKTKDYNTIPDVVQKENEN